MPMHCFPLAVRPVQPLFLALMLLAGLPAIHADTALDQAVFSNVYAGLTSPQATLDTQVTHGEPYSLRVTYQDQGRGWAVLGAPFDPARDRAVRFDLRPDSASAKAGMIGYFVEEDGDRWVAELPLAPKGEWRHYELRRDNVRPWLLGGGTPEWDRVRSFVFEWSGKGQSAVVHLSGTTAQTGAGNRPLFPLDPPDPYSPLSPARPMAKSPNGDLAYVAMSATLACSDRGQKIVAQLQPLIPHLALSINGWAGSERMAAANTRYQQMGVPVMYETVPSTGFEAKITRDQAWGVDWKGRSRQTDPFLYGPGNFHLVSYCHPTLHFSGTRKAQAATSAGIGAMNLVDFVWPWWGGRWGYNAADIAAYRRDLLGQDEGLSLAGGKKIKFWEYYRHYTGFALTPADAGLRSWAEYQPLTEETCNGAQGRRNFHLFITLMHYEWLRYLEDTGAAMARGGGELTITPNPEDLANASDYKFHLRLRYGGTPYYEFFDTPTMIAGAYHSLPDLARVARENGKHLGLITEIGHGGHGRPYFEPAVTAALNYDMTAGGGFSRFKTDFLDEGSWERLADPKDAQHQRLCYFVAGAWGFSRARAERPVHPRPALLSVWLRNINQYESSMYWRGSNWHGLSAALERGHYEYDVTDTTDLLRRLPEYRVVEYACNESPAGTMAQLRNWVAGKKDRALITHSVVPTRVMEGIHYCRFWEDVLFLQRPELGKTLGIGRITAARAAGERIDSVDPALRPYFRVGETLPVPAERFVAQGAKTLLQVGGQPLIQVKQIGNGGRIFFLAYRAGLKEVPAATEDRITAALMALLRVAPAVEAPQRLIAHTYQLAPGRVAALFDRDRFDAFSKENGSGKELLRLSAPETDLSCAVRVPNGRYRIYDLLRDREQVADAVGGALILRLRGDSMGIFYYGQDTPAWQARLAKIRAARQTVAPYLLGASSQ